MQIVFCITCKGRVQHVERTLPQNLKDNPGAKFVLLDYASQDHLLGYLKERQRSAIDSGLLAVYSYRTEGPFRMAHAKNMAHRCGLLEGAEVLVNLDADNFTGPGFAEYVEAEFQHLPGVFLWARMVKDVEGRLPRGISGRIAVSSRAFLKAGGYDERYDAWGPDDKDFAARVARLGYEAQEIDPLFLNAIMHTDKLRFREYRHAATMTGEDDFQIDAKATIANFGNFGCGVVCRNFDFSKPIVLGPVPTRIFGIGLHKTGTTSLHLALEELGFESAHWRSARWAKRIWQEVSTEGRSLTVDREYALTDLPIPFLFKELDAAYPGSKFILTLRDEEKWINSVRNHWDHEKNPFRHRWNDDPFTHKAHKLLYGQKGFNAELFLERYRRHIDEVFEHFGDRLDDLMVMDMDDPCCGGWTSLCGFLDKPIPAVPYPHAFKTAAVEKTQPDRAAKRGEANANKSSMMGHEEG